MLFGVYAGMVFLYDMGPFQTYTLVVRLFLAISQMFFLLMLDHRQKLGVTIQHLIGSSMEPLLLGCRDSTDVHPKVAKTLSKCNILAQ